MQYTDSIARLGRALAVTLVAATQRPTQKAMGQGAVRSQMDLRICFRVREPRDVDLVLGQGMLKAGWNAHKLNAPGKFLISAPEHDVPRNARAYLVTDETVTETSARHALIPRDLDHVSRNAICRGKPAASPIRVANRQRGRCRVRGNHRDSRTPRRHAMARALRSSRRRMGNRRAHALHRNDKGHALPASPRARKAGTRIPGEPWPVARMDHPRRRAVTMSDRLTGRLVSPPARASARKRANIDDETRRETSPERPQHTGRRPPMSEEEREQIRKAGAEDARRSRLQQGLPERIEDPAAIAILAALLRAPRAPPEPESDDDERKGAAISEGRRLCSLRPSLQAMRTASPRDAKRTSAGRQTVR